MTDNAYQSFTMAEINMSTIIIYILCFKADICQLVLRAVELGQRSVLAHIQRLAVAEQGGMIGAAVYKVVGKGTEAMAEMKAGKKLDILTGLGNGFTAKEGSVRPLVIGGGVGAPPMYGVAKHLVAKGAKPIVILGFTSKDDVFYEEEFKALGCDVYVTTNDGSYGTKGFVTDVIKTLEGYDYFYTCGPLPMLKAVSDATECSGQLSFEERMGCGFGGCMGCSCKTLTGNKRICTEGPVLLKEEIIW